MHIEPRLLAAWMAAQQKEAFDIGLPLQLFERIHEAIAEGIIDDPKNVMSKGKPLVVVSLNEKLYGYLASVGVDSSGLQFFVMRSCFGWGNVDDVKDIPMKFLAALDAGLGRSISNYSNWKNQIVANGWHRDKPFYRILLDILNEELALLSELKGIKAKKINLGKNTVYAEWQRRVNEEYEKNKNQSHIAICARICKELGTSAENLVRRTTNPRNKSH